MKAIHRRILSVAVAACLAVGAAAAPVWERVGNADDRELAENHDQVEVAARDGAIYITTSRTVTVKVYTVLGQLVNSATLSPGVSRLRMPARGIYILKAGSLTRRVTI